MRAVVQRVSDCSVTVEDRITGRIGNGLLVYLGVGHADGEKDLCFLVEKVLTLRIFHDAGGKMNRSVLDTGGAVLVVSQFTLYGDARKGRRPSFSAAAAPGTARRLYERFIELIRDRGIHVECGEFQADMKVTSTNDGPVTILLDSTHLF